MVWLKSLAQGVTGTSLFEQLIRRKYLNSMYKSAVI